MQSRDLGDHDITGHMTTTLQLPSFLGTNFIKCMFHQYYLVFDSWNGWKNLLAINKKVRRKNQIPKYHVFSLKKSIKMINKQLINKKPFNLVGY